ncbi:alpha-L-fucosidase [Georgenia alba]|uniref:alpha-L-fucosidase n=1 Tax=Georgenia alba TaxID=2233858 RepID=A0ABW2Q457_9MICO
MPLDVDYLANVRPSRRQYAWQQLELYAFVHLGMNTMTGREWGTGTEDPALFDPAGLDADQWAASLRAAGMRAVILTAKHHDGFCLWPSRHSTHTVAASPWRDGRGDVVRDVAEACARHGLRFGVYLSPWDRAAPSYGSGVAYDDVYVGQLVELLTGYGEIFSVWLDGANGEGPDGRRQVYDWDRYYRTIRALQPEAVISVCGPDVRWCGNEAGHTRPDEWSVVPRALQDVERIAERSQQVDDGAFSRTVRSDDQDLGSREVLVGRTGDLAWYPAEVNTSVRPGWFHHPEEDGRVRDADELFEIYLRAVGGNATLLLNVPPTREGVIAEPDREALAGLGRRITDLYGAAVPGVRMRFSSNPRGTAAEQLTLANDTGYWQPDPADPTPWVELAWDERRVLDGLVLKEQITSGQRIEDVRVLRDDGAGWVPLAATGAVGYQRILRFEPVPATALRIEIVRSRLAPTLAGVAVLAAS